jgi:type VI secretion system secreted protein Hcp
MKKISVIILLAFICFFSNFGLAYAEIKIFLYLDGIAGESIDPDYKNWIEILTWEWHMSQPGTMHVGGGGGAGIAIVRPLIVEKYIDKASPRFFIRLLNGQHITEAILAFKKGSAPPYEVLRIKMTNVLIANISSAESGGQAAEAVALAFSKVCYTYTPLKLDGTPDATIEECWDIEANMEP